MPIARPPLASISVDATRILYQNVTVPIGFTFLAGAAVAIVPDSGHQHYALCGAQAHTSLFVGFLTRDVAGGNNAIVYVGRGSKIIPLVEGDAPLIPGNDVYLSLTAGRVTQDNIPVDVHTIEFRVGSAVSATEIVLSNEFPIVEG